MMIHSSLTRLRGKRVWHTPMAVDSEHLSAVANLTLAMEMIAPNQYVESIACSWYIYIYTMGHFLLPLLNYHRVLQCSATSVVAPRPSFLGLQ